jgi:hypothetical protein
MERIISDEMQERGEEESNKMMTYAFTRMSDEVTSLIDARTCRKLRRSQPRTRSFC